VRSTFVKINIQQLQYSIEPADLAYNKTMNEKQTQSEELVRPTKKQRELLTFIEDFITEHGYSPSYREIMTGLNYTSVATVALHVNSLIKRGHLRKRDRSARSLEVVQASGEPAKISTNQVAAGEEKWLVEKIEHIFLQLENTGGELVESSLDQLYVLIGALKVLGLEGAAQSFMPRLTELKKRQSGETVI
jgi:repressor LexA